MTGRNSFWSPACYAHETDPEYAGYLGRDEILALLADAHRLATGQPFLQDSIVTIIVRLGGVTPGQTEDGARPDPTTTECLRAALPKIGDDEVYQVIKTALHGG